VRPGARGPSRPRSSCSSRSVSPPGADPALADHGRKIVRHRRTPLPLPLPNRPVARLRRRRELTGRSGSKFVHPDDVEGRPAALSRRAWRSPGATEGLEWLEFAPRTGRWPPGLEIATTNLLDDPTIRGLVLKRRDVSERKHAEQSLQRQHRAVPPPRPARVGSSPWCGGRGGRDHLRDPRPQPSGFPQPEERRPVDVDVRIGGDGRASRRSRPRRVRWLGRSGGGTARRSPSSPAFCVTTARTGGSRSTFDQPAVEFRASRAWSPTPAPTSPTSSSRVRAAEDEKRDAGTRAALVE